MSEKFCLKWNDFNSNTSRAFGLLRSEEFLQDVTLVGDDNSQVAAHKLVLSACSEYFKSIFKKNKHSHPLLCLEGVSSKDVRNMINYMYNGEVQIFQEDLDRFLAVAQRLKLQGLLTDPGANQENDVKRTFKNENIQKEMARPNSAHLEKIQEKVIVKVNTDINLENISEINEQIEQNIIKNLDGTYSCQVCGKNSVKKISHIKNHIETHLEGLCFNCPLCEKTFRSRHSLASHKSKCHK